MNDRVKLMRRAAQLGVLVELVPDHLRSTTGGARALVRLTAPAGCVFGGTDIHESIVCGEYDGEPMSALVAVALRDLVCGVEPCTTPDCEWCADARAEGGAR